jgi:hypothetical protein
MRDLITTPRYPCPHAWASRTTPVSCEVTRMRQKRIGLLIAISAMSLIFGAAAPPAYAEGSVSEAATTNTTQVSLAASGVSAPHSTLLPTADTPALPGIQRHCSGVTCNFYFSKSQTTRIQRVVNQGSVSIATVSAAICAPTGVAVPVCTAGLAANMERIKSNVNSAVKRKGCFSVRYNGLVGGLIGPPQPGLAVSFANVRGNHPKCKA